MKRDNNWDGAAIYGIASPFYKGTTQNTRISTVFINIGSVEDVYKDITLF